MEVLLPSAEQLRSMMEESDGHRVSIYMPARKAGPSTRENPIRLKNLVRQAEELLINSGERAPEARAMLAPAQRLVNDTGFWRNPDDGIAIFLSEDGFDHFELPASFEEMVTVGRRYHLKPMLPLYAGDGLFYILALSQNNIRLIEGSRFSVHEFERTSLPANIASVLFFLDVERQFEFRQMLTGPHGNQRQIGHRHGAGADNHKERIAEFFKNVDKALRDFVGERKVPLVMAGVDYLIPIFQSVSSYPWLVDVGIVGNPDGLPARELHKRAWELVNPVFQLERNKAVAAYRQMAGTGRTAKGIQEVISCAWDGRIATLFVALDQTCWGRASEGDRTVEIHENRQANDEDLLDRTAIEAISGGGTVWAVPKTEMPEDAPLAAVLRF